MASALYGRKLPTRVLPTNNWINGIADFDKLGGSYSFGRSVDYRSNPRQITLLPKTTKESGTVYMDLPKWGERIVSNSTTYIYDRSGNLYSRSSAGSHTFLRATANSHGNGLKYYGEDDFLYYTTDKTIGRYGPIAGTPTFTDDYFGSSGGVPTNTNSLTLLSASSQYATAADSASLSITGNIAMEAYVRPASLPTVGNSMTIIGKWDESGATKSYIMDILGISGYFGDASGGNLTISVDTTDAPIDSACTGTSGAFVLSATNASFASGQVIFIHQTRGTGAGTWQRNSIQGYTAGTITLSTALNANYIAGAQVLVVKQYGNVTINSGKTWTAKAWNGTVGGILAFLANGTLSINGGTISANACGFRGGSGYSSNTNADAGEGTVGASIKQQTANGNGGGGALGTTQSGGGAGGNGTAGSDGNSAPATDRGFGGNAAGTADLTTAVFGGGGGGGGNAGGTGGNGGIGGGLIFYTVAAFSSTGTITCNGGVGGNASGSGNNGGGGGGAGGSILGKVQTATLGTITASGGGLGAGIGATGVGGGVGGDGRIHLDYLTSYSGSTTPTLNVTQDNSLVTTTSYQLRFGVSNDGTASEYLTRNLTSLTIGTWTRLAISWVASTHICTFYQDGVNLGTSTGTKSAISDNASLLYVGADKTSVVANFLNALLDDVRIWNTTRTDSQMSTLKDVELIGNESGLVAYYKLNSAATDLTANTNDLTLVNAPSYTTTVPFSNATTRLDIDQSQLLTGNTYSLISTIDESATTKYLSFVPAKDPQKSMDIKIGAKGTGNWTITIHDGLNRVITTVTVANATLPASGYYEFVYSSVWRPVIGQTYHAHFTSSDATGTIVTGTSANLATGNYHTYYQFLVSDVDYHPILDHLNLISFGNERYLATYNGSTYNPHALKFPAGFRVRSLARYNEYLAIGCWKGTAISDYDEGYIFFWDGYSTTYNFFVIVPEGGINAMFGAPGELHIFAGYKGDYLVYTGGAKAIKKKRIPKSSIDKTTQVLPGAITMWQTLLRFGIGSTDSSDIERGVYTYGSTNESFANSISYDYPISTGLRNATVTIGMVMAVDKKLLIGWQDNTSYGVDVVDPAGSCFTTGTVESLLVDDGIIWKEKKNPYIRVDFLPLVTGQTITLKSKIDRASSWTTVSTTTVGVDHLRLPLSFDRHKEAQIAVDIATSTTTPTILEMSLLEDYLFTESQGIE